MGTRDNWANIVFEGIHTHTHCSYSNKGMEGVCEPENNFAGVRVSQFALRYLIFRISKCSKLLPHQIGNDKNILKRVISIAVFNLIRKF